MTWNVEQLVRDIALSGDRKRRAFTLIELLVVMAIIAILAALSIPALRAVSKSNDDSQATNLVRSMIGNARAIAISQHRMAGVVFFEESSTYSLPANANQTAMQLFIEDFNQGQWNPLPGMTVFIKYSSSRQYLPAGMKVAALTDAAGGGNVETGDTASASANYQARAILFDSNGQLVTRGGLAAPPPPNPLVGAGTYPQAYGDWRFIGVQTLGAIPAVANASSYPGFFLYNKTEYDNQSNTPAGAKVAWLLHHSSVVLINPNTGTVVIDRGPGQ